MDLSAADETSSKCFVEHFSQLVSFLARESFSDRLKLTEALVGASHPQASMSVQRREMRVIHISKGIMLGLTK